MKLCTFASLLAVAEAFGSSAAVSTNMRIQSKAEIMASMTSETALNTVLNMSRASKKHKLITLIETKFGLKASKSGRDDHDHDDDEESETDRRVLKGRRMMAQLQTALRGTGKAGAGGDGYTAVAGATKMLNEMSSQTLLDLELEESRCETEEEDSRRNMNLLRNQVTTYNGEAAGSRGRVLDAQGQIQTFEVNLRQTDEEYKQHQKDCQREIGEIKYELTIVSGDVAVMKNVLQLIDCGAQTTGSFMLVQCKGCKNSMMVRHHQIQSLLNGLKSQATKKAVEQKLNLVYKSMADDEDPAEVAFIETGMHEIMRATEAPSKFTNASVVMNISSVPVPPAAVDCQSTDKCTLASSPSCQKLKDKFIAVQAGIVDKEKELKKQLGEKEDWCEAQDTYYVNLMDALNGKLSTQRSNLAVATEDQNVAESGSHSSAEQHSSAATEYTKTRKSCCDNQNTFKSELCALGKIRGELNNLNGTKVYITDCELSDWTKEECSASCDGGRVKSTRSILTHQGGMGIPCGTLVKQESCNSHACPVSCVLEEWSQWSECGAQCGGGVKERTRGKRQDAMNGGEPCGSLEVVETCNGQACNVDCELSDWSEWTTCSMACDGGSQRRTKFINEQPIGTGNCWEVDDPKRLQFKDCNIRSCHEVLGQENKTMLECRSYVDVQFLMDGSASLGHYGWAMEQKVMEALMGQMNGGIGNAMISLELFSGPSTWDNYEACTEGTAGVDLKEQCGIEQVSHMTSDFGGVRDSLRALEFPGRSSLMSVALGLAEQEIKYGRVGAAPVVVVVTDGEPISVMQTIDAAHRLQTAAKVIWVAIGGDAPMEMIEEVAQLPQHEHIVHVPSFYELRETWAFNALINELVTKICPEAGSPCVAEPLGCACMVHKDATFCSSPEGGHCMELCPNASPFPEMPPRGPGGPPRGGQSMLY